MGDKTGIQWTDATWNPVRGCSRVSEGCRYCYAERVAARFSGPGQPYDGLVRPMRVGLGNQRAWSGVVRMVPEHLADPLRWKKPRRIFVNSMSDLFHEKLTNEEIAAVFGVMAAAPRHTFQVLTKRAERMRDWFRWLETESEGQGDEWAGRECGVSVHDARDACRMETLDEAACDALAGHFDCCHLGLTTSKVTWPLPNVWLGVSIENQAAADARIGHLLATPAAVRFLSCEPLLGALDLQHVHHEGVVEIDALAGTHGVARPHGATNARVDWVIAGCESGPGARPAEVGWYRSLRDQCAAAGVPFFLKQAVRVAGEVEVYAPDNVEMRDTPDGARSKGGGVIGLPYLDGVQHAAFPESR